ncbi:uncharacterized protein LOC107613175 [Arachis ipaensis]|uniref:uncharacterized protein LOC107613175 n=1 Tax=Arachis ipaensis TaxID=130454 RepID=UPI0007AF631D|nr:uncharacterized protein LOC107613175 [Arachis ipaensis]
MSTFQVLLALTAQKGWFLPLGLSALPNSVCKLERSLYGLKQASSSTTFTDLLVYVDDLVLARNDMKEIERVKALLDAKFKIKDLGFLKYFLGFKVARSSQSILLYQHKYAIDLLDKFGLLNAKPTSTPMNYTAPLSKCAGSPSFDLTPYCRLIGRLLYLMNTRPDISFAVNKLSQYLDCATDMYFKVGLHILEYIKGAPARGILFSTTSDLCLIGYSDSDWGICPSTRRSKSRKQLTVARSSADAEYRTLALATFEGRWLTYILRDLQVPLCKPITLFCDNQSAIHIASNPVFQEHTKHIKINCHTVQNRVYDGSLKLLPVPSSEQVVDILTKSLAPGPFAKIHCKIGIHDIHVPSLREVDRRNSSS